MESKVADILKEKGNNVVSVSPDTTIYDSIKTMAENKIGAVLVMDGDKLAGIFTERDYTQKTILKGLSSKDTAVKEVMTSQVASVSPESTMMESMTIMTEKKCRHLPVFDGDKLVGVVSIGNLAERVIKDYQHTINELNEYIAGNWDNQ